MSFPTLAITSFLSNEIALPISCNDALFDYTTNWKIVSYTGWKDGQTRAPAGIRWTPLNLNEDDFSDDSGNACFTEGTQIVVGAEFTEDGAFTDYVTVNIEDIEVGDLVYSYDTVTGEVSQQEVTDVFVREVDHINYLTVLDEEGNEQIIETTDSHPFWVVTNEPDLERAARSMVDENGVILSHQNLDPSLNGYWVEAQDLQEGDIFLDAFGGLPLLVSKERVEFAENVNVYNFTVESNHNYFVLAEEGDQTSLLVHNAEYDAPEDKVIADLQGRLHGVSELGKGAEGVLNTASGFIPMASGTEAWTGENASGRERLKWWERILSFFGAIPGGAMAVKGARWLTRVDDAAEVVRTLQTGGHILEPSTLKALGLTKEQGRSAIEALKGSNKIPHNVHLKIMSDGSVIDSHTKINYGTLYEYLHGKR